MEKLCKLCSQPLGNNPNSQYRAINTHFSCYKKLEKEIKNNTFISPLVKVKTLHQMFLHQTAEEETATETTETSNQSSTC